MNSVDNANFFDMTYKSVLDALPCYLTIQDANLNILFVNETFKKDFGNGIGQPCYEVFKDYEHQCKKCPVQKTFKNKKVNIAEETIRFGDGTVNQMIVYTAPLFDVAGNVTSVIKMLTNVDVIKKVQKELVTLGQSVAVLTHDMKNMLEGLEGGVYVVDEAFKDRDMELADKGWGILKKNVSELSRVTQNILYSAKKRAPKFRRKKPNEVAMQVMDMFRDKANAMNIQLACQLNPSLPSTTMDASSIKRMLNNLIWNALEACDKKAGGGFRQINVRADFYNSNHYMFEIEDNADGMGDEAQANLFQEFFSTKGASGTGLGLMVVDRIARNHKGKIEVLTKKGTGSMFRIILPISAASG